LREGGEIDAARVKTMLKVYHNEDGRGVNREWQTEGTPNTDEKRFMRLKITINTISSRGRKENF
jgi:hypothetical protein